MPAADVLAPLENVSLFERSDPRFLPMPHEGLLTEAYFYDAMLARSRGDIELMEHRLEQILQTGYRRYIEHKLAWFFLQELRGQRITPGKCATARGELDVS